MRAAYEQRPIPNQSTCPQIKTATGLGTGGGAGLLGGSDGGWGAVEITPGPGFGATGTLVLHFPAGAPPTLAVAANWATLVLTPGQDYSIAWTKTGAVTPGRRLRIDYEWATA